MTALNISANEEGIPRALMAFAARFCGAVQHAGPSLSKNTLAIARATDLPNESLFSQSSNSPQSAEDNGGHPASPTRRLCPQAILSGGELQ